MREILHLVDHHVVQHRSNIPILLNLQIEIIDNIHEIISVDFSLVVFVQQKAVVDFILLFTRQESVLAKTGIGLLRQVPVFVAIGVSAPFDGRVDLSPNYMRIYVLLVVVSAFDSRPKVSGEVGVVDLEGLSSQRARVLVVRVNVVFK